MNEEHKKLYAEYLKEISISHRGQGVRDLKVRIPWLFEYLESEELNIREVGVKEAQGYQGWLIEKGKSRAVGPYARSTVACYVKAAVSFFDFLKKRGYTFTNPFTQIGRVWGEKSLPKNILKEKEIDVLLDALVHFTEAKSFKGQITRYRVHVVAELQYASGLRISEVAALKVEDIDFRRRMVLVREGKSGISRFAFLNEFAAEVLRLYVERLRPLVSNEWNERNGELLFGNLVGGLEKNVNRELKRLTKELGLPKLTSHGFRHALGYHLLRAGCNIRYIQEILGHKHLKNTEVYTKVDKENLKEVLDTYHPRRWRKEQNTDEEADK